MFYPPGLYWSHRKSRALVSWHTISVVGSKQHCMSGDPSHSGAGSLDSWHAAKCMRCQRVLDRPPILLNTRAVMCLCPESRFLAPADVTRISFVGDQCTHGGEESLVLDIPHMSLVEATSSNLHFQSQFCRPDPHAPPLSSDSLADIRSWKAPVPPATIEINLC